MSGAGLDFGSLIWPVETETFFRCYWEKQPLLVARQTPTYYSGLLSWRDIDTLLHFNRPEVLGAPRAAGTTGLGAPHRDERLFDGNLQQACQRFARGERFVIHGLQRYWPPVATLGRHLEQTLQSPLFGAELFIAPNDWSGGPPHFDTAAAFVLQIQGSKHWRLFGPAPQSDQQAATVFVPEEQLGAPLQEFHLEAGDLLYLPFGHVHQAFTTEESSLHITVFVRIMRWADLLSSALACLRRQDSRFWEPLPPGFLGQETVPTTVLDHWQALLQAFTANARAADAVACCAEDFIRNMPLLPDGRFLSVDHIDHINLDTVVQKHQGMICRVIQERDTVRIVFPGGQVRGPNKIASALHYIAGARDFAVRSLPDDLSADGKLVLARKLLREGLLTIADRGTEPGVSPRGPCC